MSRIGFLLGKFMPPHAGHLHLIQEAAKQCDELVILVCSVAKEPIPGAVRFNWMRELCGRHELIHVTDEVPSSTDGDPRFWEIWEALLGRVLPPNVEVVFSSEDYGDEIARRLGISHVMIDPARSMVPVSASMVREDPFAAWQWIPHAVRPWYVGRIAVVGAESSGKSVLTRQLADYFATTFVAEYGREHTALMPQVSARITPQDFIDIAEEHSRRIELAARAANRLLFVDTEALTTAIWSEWYLGSTAPELWERVDREYMDHYLLLAPDLPWEDDGTREFPSRREDFFNRLSEELDRRGRRYTIISGAGEQRMLSAAQAVLRQWPQLAAILTSTREDVTKSP